MPARVKNCSPLILLTNKAAIVAMAIRINTIFEADFNKIIIV